MSELIRRRASVTYLLLVLITGVSFWLTVGGGGALIGEAHSVVWVQVIVLACLKVRWVMLDFMELRTAPTGLRALFEVWVVALGAALIAISVLVG
jgi:heme/copper-type cytochrome/quinol oxidase subunit 4